MNKKTVFTVIAIVALIAGIVLGTFTDVGNDLPAICLSAFGLGTLIILTYNKSEKKGGVLIASIICMVISGFAAAFAVAGSGCCEAVKEKIPRRSVLSSDFRGIFFGVRFHPGRLFCVGCGADGVPRRAPRPGAPLRSGGSAGGPGRVCRFRLRLP